MNVDVKKLKEDVQAYADAHKGQIYAPVNIPGFEEFRAQHGPERFDILLPHIPREAKTALDIGSHWGYFAHRFEEAGLDVTAVENNARYLSFLTRIKDAAGAKFRVYDKSIFDLPDTGFDVVLALNIFHHFIKTKELADQFEAFLGRLDSQLMFFQAHSTSEGQMSGAYHNFEPDDFCQYIISNSRYEKYESIGRYGSREIFKITK